MRCTRALRQEAMAIWETKVSSVGVVGWCSASRRSSRASKSAGSSPGRMRVSAYKPYLRPFRRTAARPSGVDGPVECCALRRLASICRSVDMAHLRQESGLDLEFSSCRIVQDEMRKTNYAVGCNGG